MWHVGIDLHRRSLMIAAVHDSGEAFAPVRLSSQDDAGVQRVFESLRPFRAVIEASASYRWLYDRLLPLGVVLVAHPLRLRAMVQRRSKTDKLDSQLLANLLRIDQIPLSYVPPPEFQQLRELTRYRARLGRAGGGVKVGLRAILARQNREAPYKVPFGPRGLDWFRRQDFGPIENELRDDLLERLESFERRIARIDLKLELLARQFPQTAAILDIRGIGLYSALVIIAELGDAQRFRSAKQVGAYAGLATRVRQSGDVCRHGRISRDGSPWLRWILVEAAMKVVSADPALKNFYQRVRKRSSAKTARVAVARKLAEICWKRLRRWQRQAA